MKRITGPDAARWRKRKYDQLRRYSIPEDALPGSLSLTTVTCGKPTCHCANGEGHPHYTLTFMSDGKRRVVHIPEAYVEEVRSRVEAGKRFQDAVRDVLTANAELMILAHRQARASAASRKKRRPPDQ
ncbi:MAG TPA: hypothetical protein PK916_18070 [Bacteroidota bacterium]|nr:hypothetical protein [Bacteroidota bacterium]